jgi:two-component system phosphate regulon sensor histidine kinase PhoR
MLSSQLFWRVLAVYAALIVGTGLAFGGILSARYRSLFHEQARQSVKEQARMLQALVEAHPERTPDGQLPEPLQTLLNRLAKVGSRRGLIFSEAGVPLWDSQPTAPAVLTADDVPRELASLAEQDDVATLADAAGEEGLCFVLHFGVAPQPTGYVWVGQSLQQLTVELAARDYRLWCAAAAIGLVALGVTYLIVGRIIGPLETLTQAAQQIAAGDLSPEVQVQSRNEIGTLATAFRSMSQQLSGRIHDLQEQRSHLEQSHARLETVLGAMLEGVMAVDAEERILFANNAAIRLLDLKPTMMVGQRIWEAVRHAQLEDLVHQALSGEQPPRLEFDVARTQCTVAVTVSPLPGQPVPGAVMVLHDVTELRRLESLRREFVQNVSHELKTPLSSITAYADTLLEGALEDPDSNRHFVQRIAEQSDRLHLLILDLLALGQMEAEEAAYEVQPIDVSRIAVASVDAHQGVARAKQIALITEGATGPLLGLGEDDGLRTILDNLLDNAINYTPEGGRVTVRWRRMADAVVIDVADTGVGIAREHQTRIFERFYRIDKARSRELGGTGLGLSIVKHLCQVFGGTVKVSSQLGQGSTFTVRLKAAVQAVAASLS